MTADELKAKIDIPDVELSRSVNDGYWHVRVMREHAGHRYVFSKNVADDISDMACANLFNEINGWWADTIADQLPSASDAQAIEHKEV